ncbi:uncharacterized protein GGS22DRAFT_163787 [Annulohypoxylon maeteangense]|uniref:uncharacterized protein n=1 Tax=Annulohypoxylon maeteangense TaxID=1927788 RepID=UPI002007E315|nr:uncharacterized protein GGS22DRAFT_163787 [Annulohypoxylon maeteangense]KAI0884553.1 hypothetical protein GGS22DRAFT_163787 [Annulohypoxylon maeteangense]
MWRSGPRPARGKARSFSLATSKVARRLMGTTYPSVMSMGLGMKNPRRRLEGRPLVGGSGVGLWLGLCSTSISCALATCRLPDIYGIPCSRLVVLGPYCTWVYVVNSRVVFTSPFIEVGHASKDVLDDAWHGALVKAPGPDRWDGVASSYEEGAKISSKAIAIAIHSAVDRPPI